MSPISRRHVWIGAAGGAVMATLGLQWRWVHIGAQLLAVPPLPTGEWDFTAASGLPPGLVVADAGVKGWGLFIQRPVAAGEVVYRFPLYRHWGDRALSFRTDLGPREVRLASHGICFFDRLYFFAGWHCLVNHSCRANAYHELPLDGRGMVLRAVRAMAAGDEVVVDYDALEPVATPFRCACGEPECRDWVRGYRSLRAKERAALQPYIVFPEWLI